MKTCPECHGEFQDTVSKCPQDNIDLENHVNPLIGSCLADRYQILAMLGSGGTGVVYKAQHLKMDKPVAIKMMHLHMMARPDALKSFYEEAKTVAQLKHHNIVTLYDFGLSSTNQPFLVMDFIEGPSLKKYVETNGPISLEQMRPLMSQIADGLSYAHTEGIVHQDLKPENIMLTDIGQAVDKISIVDFGLATLCSPDKDNALSGNKKKQFVGSPYYMSPEQCLSSSVIDSRSDIYSLAIVLYEALSNNLPFEKRSAMSMMDSHVRETPNPFIHSNPELIGSQACFELTKVFDKAMTKEPDGRYQNVAEFAIELDEALARDAVKMKAIKHRSLVAEQVLVHANETVQSQSAIGEGQIAPSKLNLHSGTQFLSQQADIEEAYLNRDSDLPEKSKSKPSTENVKKENTALNFMKKLVGICETSQSKESDTNTLAPALACSNCKTPLKPGVQFCLNCQRTVAPSSRPVNLSDARNGNSFTYHRVDGLDLDEQIVAKNKLQNLRQQRIVRLSKLQKYLNYALIAAMIIGGLIVIQHYIADNPLETIISMPNLTQK